ncbi:MAG: TIGR02186 family protein [Rhodobacteraceae bacterium]|nr:TIGR02186 family protein [Paracoccaceae bacterium]
MRQRARVLVCSLGAVLLFAAAHAETVVLGLSQHEVAITTDFRGSHLWIFGAVRREAPIPTDSDLDVIITVTGPALPVDVRRKERRFGIWVNAESVHLSRVPSFYAVASTKPLSDVLSATEDLRHHISVGRLVHTVGAAEVTSDVESFTSALERIRTREGLFQSQEGAVAFDEDTLFSTSLALPSNIVEGAYATRIFLVRDRKVVDWAETEIDVHKVGLERWLYTLAHRQPLVYGAMSLVIAIAAGWLASAVFRIFRR